MDHKDLCHLAATLMAGILANPNNRIGAHDQGLIGECLQAARYIDEMATRATLHKDGFVRPSLSTAPAPPPPAPGSTWEHGSVRVSYGDPSPTPAQDRLPPNFNRV